MGFGHEGRAAFMPAGDETDARPVLVKAVERRQETLPRHTEDRIDALRDEGLDERMASRAGAGFFRGEKAAHAGGL